MLRLLFGDLFAAQLHNAVAEMEKEKFAVRKKHTEDMQELLEDTNARLSKMEEDYLEQIKSTVSSFVNTQRGHFVLGENAGPAASATRASSPWIKYHPSMHITQMQVCIEGIFVAFLTAFDSNERNFCLCGFVDYKKGLLYHIYFHRYMWLLTHPLFEWSNTSVRLKIKLKGYLK